MLLYLSAGTAYEIYDDLFERGWFRNGGCYQAQRFNFNIIKGLSHFEEVTAVSALPYGDVEHSEIDETVSGVHYIGIRNRVGFLHKYYNVKYLAQKGSEVIKKNNVRFILCDAISLCHEIAALALAKRYHIPVIAIVTDLPEVMCSGEMSMQDRLDAFLMKRFDGYVLLTRQMNDIANPRNKPSMIMEGSCSCDYPCKEGFSTKEKSVCIYGGSLWERAAGIEYLMDGFLKANVPNCELHLYGTGALVERIQSISAQHPQIQYKGCVTNKELLLRQAEADLLINPRPSTEAFCKYSFPSKTFEYMASGTPVLMTKLPGILEEYFEHVFTIEQETADGMCEALRDVFGRPPEELLEKGRRAREFVTSKKNNVVQARRIFEFLQDCEKR